MESDKRFILELNEKQLRLVNEALEEFGFLA